jgi:asparagine N-glycosylation enzyme membrane subunit Stt3
MLIYAVIAFLTLLKESLVSGTVSYLNPVLVDLGMTEGDTKKILDKRKEKIKNWLFKNEGYAYLVMTFLIITSYLMRIKNIKYLVDATTGKYIPLALDPFIFLRYAKETLANGGLATVDMMRYFPWGFEQLGEFILLPKVIVALYKFLHIFNPNVTLEYVHVIYPPVFFCLGLIFFYALIKRLFDTRVALLASAFLMVLPSYLYRSIAGFSDKESLAMFFMFAAMYFYVRAWQEDKIKLALFFGVLSGITSGLMGLTWGGVRFLFLIFGFFALIQIALNKFSEKDFYVYTSWLFFMMLILKMFYGTRYNFSNLALSITSGIMFLTFVVGVVNLLITKYNLFGLNDKLKEKFPTGVFSIIISLIFSVIFVAIIEGFGSIIGKIQSFITDLISPFGFNRWILTVAESHQPYIRDWIAQWGWFYLLIMLAGSVFLVNYLLKDIKGRWKGVGFYTLFILAFVFSRYKVGTKLDGVTTFSKTLYIGSLIALGIACLVIYFYSFKKNKELYNKILNFDKNLLFVIVWFLVLTVAARGAVRLLHIYSPITTILVAYFFVKVYDYAKSLKKDNLKYLKYGIYVILILMLVMPGVKGTLFNLYQTTSKQAEFTGPSYNGQWQFAMKWVRENTTEDAVFAHWWDYGYWVQTGGERATLTDGGNAKGYGINHFMGRHVLTAQNETEALEYLYARNATHLLMIKDEIGKYPAYSSIGSDENYDRYGWLSTFQLDDARIQERRNDTLLFYVGSHAFDDDFVHGEQIFPKKSSGIAAVLLPAKFGEGGIVGIEQPEAIIVYAGKQFNVPLECVFVNGEEVVFDKPGLKGCLMLLPRKTGEVYTPLGAGLYISEKIRRTLFTHLFLYGKETEFFKLAYTDQQYLPLSFMDGRFIGPLKIWEVNYPEGIEPKEWYYGKELPNLDVMNI